MEYQISFLVVTVDGGQHGTAKAIVQHFCAGLIRPGDGQLRQVGAPARPDLQVRSEP